MSATYIVTTPNETYSGRTLGVNFSDGKAVINAATIDKRIVPNVKVAVKRFVEEFGYKVRLLDGKEE